MSYLYEFPEDRDDRLDDIEASDLAREDAEDWEWECRRDMEVRDEQ